MIGSTSRGVGGYRPAAGVRTVQGVGGYPPGWRRKNCRYIGYKADVWPASRRSGDRSVVRSVHGGHTPPARARLEAWKGCVAARKAEKRAQVLHS